jgi:hypothetical protein
MTDLPKEPTISPQSDLLGCLFSSCADAWRIGLGVSEMPAGVDVFGDGVLSAPAQACWIGFTAWLRYSGAVAEAFARYEASLIQAELDRADEGRGTSPSAGRVLVDEARAFLRRVGDAATLEARRAQHELEQIGESIAQAAAAGDGTSLDHVRRHEIKA